MRTKHTLTIPALAASLLLGLTACGSSDNNDPIKSADSTPTHSAEHKTTSPKPSSSTPNSKPTFHFPKDLKVKVDANKTGDPTKDKILQDHRYAMMADQASLAKGEPIEFFGHYWTGMASIRVTHDYAKYKKKHLSSTGEDHFYDRKVQSHTKKTAIVTYCEDQTKVFDKNKKTGETINPTPDPQYYINKRSILKKSNRGTWRVYNVQESQGDKKCKQDS